jgi:hypothetical protein
VKSSRFGTDPTAEKCTVTKPVEMEDHGGGKAPHNVAVPVKKKKNVRLM